FNDLHEYVAGLKRAIKTPSEEYAKIGLQKDGKYLQINSNILQIENGVCGPISAEGGDRRGGAPPDAPLGGGCESV
ncbi:glutamate--cysteine ligase, partial [Mycobacterium tuberculosis]|nr:glutamate--cysteine ligase [Mycobacterium tuberculosis]